MRPRVVVFGTGSPLSVAALAAASRAAEVLAIVTPPAPPLWDARAAGRRVARWKASRPLRALARRLGVRNLDARRLDEDLARLAPDLICVASYPRLLGPALLKAARHGAIGLHPSLLPVHRGPDPLFWTYFEDDRRTGITLHWLDEGEDTGDILYQDAQPLTRGRPVTDLYQDLARRGASLLERALAEIPGGRAPRERQDASRATRQGLADLASCRIDWRVWSAERVFHFLSGVGRWYPHVAAPAGERLRFGEVLLGASAAHDRPAGTLEPCPGGLKIYCRDGVVELPGATRARQPLRSLWDPRSWQRRASG
jgi:methionyl-tRNA formyltransferase